MRKMCAGFDNFSNENYLEIRQTPYKTEVTRVGLEKSFRLFAQSARYGETKLHLDNRRVTTYVKYWISIRKQ